MLGYRRPDLQQSGTARRKSRRASGRPDREVHPACDRGHRQRLWVDRCRCRNLLGRSEKQGRRHCREGHTSARAWVWSVSSATMAPTPAGRCLSLGTRSAKRLLIQRKRFYSARLSSNKTSIQNLIGLSATSLFTIAIPCISHFTREDANHFVSGNLVHFKDSTICFGFRGIQQSSSIQRLGDRALSGRT